MVKGLERKGEKIGTGLLRKGERRVDEIVGAVCIKIEGEKGESRRIGETEKGAAHVVSCKFRLGQHTHRQQGSRPQTPDISENYADKARGREGRRREAADEMIGA